MTRYMPITLLGLTLLSSLMACAPKLTGPTVPSGYVFSLQALPPSVVRLSANVGGEREQTERGMVATLVVWVQDGQGRPVNGVPVEFQVEPSWVQDASLAPARALTQGGKAEALFRAQNIGVVSVMARVENTTQQVAITVVPRGGGAGTPEGGE